MKSQALKYYLPIAALALTLGTAAHAAPLAFTASPARDAATQLEDKYGIHIVFKNSLNARKPVTFSIGDADSPGARLEAVSAFANAANADFQKTYVVSKAPAGSTNIPADQIDSNGIVAFPQTTLSAEDAIRRIAGADSAIARFSGPIGSTVTLSASSLTVKQAAREVAAQTHTQWKTYYALVPQGQGSTFARQMNDSSQAGAPIPSDPFVYYKKQTVAPTARTAQTPQASNPQEPGQPQIVSAQDAGNGSGYGQMPYGDPNSPYFYPYGFNNYAGNNPYSQNIYAGGPNFGNGGYNNGGYSNGSGLDISSGYGAPIVFGGN